MTVLYDYRAAVMQNSHAASGSHNVAGRMSRELPRERRVDVATTMMRSDPQARYKAPIVAAIAFEAV